jgi:signal transduction histidine kinase
MTSWYRDLRLRWKLMGAFGLVLFLTTALSLLAYRGVVANDESAALVTETRVALRQADEALLSLVDMETGVRGFLLTGQEEFLDPYDESREVYQQRLDRLVQGAAGRPELERLWRSVDQRTRAWVSGYADPAVRLRREVDSGARPAGDIAQLPAAAGGKAQLDSVRQDFARAAALEEAILEERDAQARAANAWLKTVLLGGTALTLGLGLAISFLLARDLSTVAGRLETAAGRIANGDLAYRIGLRRRDEFGITARAFDQMALQLSTADLEREQANAGLRAANAELEQFAYTVSHDLKAPLVTIQGFAHRLTKDYSERLDEAGRRYLSRIEASATHLGVLIEDVLAFSRVGRIGAPPVGVDLDAVLRRALEGLQEEAEARGARVDVLSPLPVVVASPTLVGQIVGNLLANALTYGAPKGAAPQIDVSCDDLGESWRLRVRDHGPGIPADQRDRLFRLFERLPAGKAANPSGTGVGLATVRKAAQAMGGTAGVETPEDGGASFWVEFPKVPPGAISSGPGPGALESAAPDRDSAQPALARS